MIFSILLERFPLVKRAKPFKRNHVSFINYMQLMRKSKL